MLVVVVINESDLFDIKAHSLQSATFRMFDVCFCLLLVEKEAMLTLHFLKLYKKNEIFFLPLSNKFI